MADATLVLDEEAIGEWLRTSPELRAYLEDLGRKGLAYARSIAPVGTRTTPSTTPGQYRDSLFTEIIIGPTRMGLRIGTRDYTAWWIEYGSKHNPRVAVLRRTLDYLRGGYPRDGASYSGITEYDTANPRRQGARAARRRTR